MARLQGRESRGSVRVGRRGFLVGGLVGAAGLVARRTASASAVYTGDWLLYTSSGPDGASVSYPAMWRLDPGTTRELTLDPSLGYPRQSFAVRTSVVKPRIEATIDGGGLPDLSTYPTDAAIIWLMYYDQIVEGPRVSNLSLARLLELEPRFDGFRSYVARFSNSIRSFLLWTWIGSGASDGTVSAVDACLRSVVVPS